MNAAVTSEEAARNFDALLDEVSTLQQETTITRDGVPVAKIVPIDKPRTGAEIAALWRKFREEDPMSMEERNAFADDIEAAHKAGNQPLVYRWD